MRRRLLFLLISVVCLSPVRAQEKTWLAGVGYAALLDTYLSQEHYSGIEVNLLHDMTKPLRRDSVWTRTHTYQLELAYTRPRSHAATDYAAMFDYSFGMHRHFIIAGKVDLAIGGQAHLFVGGIYNTRNGNNPAQAKVGIDLAPTLRAAYRFRLRRQHLRVNYCANLPLIGMQFSPAYGQSYYEIFVNGNYDHNVCLLSPFSGVNFYHRLTVDLFFRRAALTFGYLSNCRQSSVHHLKYHSYSHAFVVGCTL